MINPDELEPRPVLKSVDMQQMSVRELNEYIGQLEAEIQRGEQAIAKKEAHKSGIDAIFGGSPKK